VYEQVIQNGNLRVHDASALSYGAFKAPGSDQRRPLKREEGLEGKREGFCWKWERPEGWGLR
jgi:hypothetical protein